MREVGPKIGEPVMNSEDILRSLRLAKAKGIWLTTISRYTGTSSTYLTKCRKRGHFGVRVAGRLSWVLRAINAGDLVPLHRKDQRSAQDLVRAADWLELTPTPRFVKCICGRYEKCPCGLAQPEIQADVPCRSSHSDAAIRDAAENMIRLLRSHVVPPVDRSVLNGFRLKSLFAKSARKSTAT